MPRELSPEEVQRHNELYRKGCQLTEGELLVARDDKGPRRGPLGPLARQRLVEAIRCLTMALEIAPSQWQTLWVLGKIHQRLDDHVRALSCFGRAHEINPAQPEVAREASIAAGHLGMASDAVRYSKIAVALRPNDPGLVANLAVAFLISGKVDLAQAAAAEAYSRAPNDPVTRYTKGVTDQVAAGKRAIPSTTLELERIVE